MRAAKKALSLLLALCLTLAMLPLSAMAANGLPFTDVAATDWFYDGVKYAYENSLMVGTSGTTFSPGTTTTRSMVVTILHRLDDSPVASTSGTFTDVETDAWYTAAIEWAVANGIVSGYGNGRFGPNDTITREQMATIIHRYSNYKGYDVSKQNDLSQFTDVGEVNDWAKTAMAWTNAEGLITGTSNTTLSPKGNATRAQVAVILNRFCENIVAKASKGEDKPTDTNTPQSTFTVTFELNYSTAGTHQTVSVNSGDKVSQPTNPTRGGYSFNGWYTAKSGGQRFNFNTAITKDITLFAHWSSNSSSGGGEGSSSGGYEPAPSIPPVSQTYNVRFFMDESSNSTLSEQKVNSGAKASRPSDPSRVGYDFDYWYILDGEEPLIYDFGYGVAENLNIYAHWSAIPSETEVDSKDSDEDGLSDEQEAMLGTDLDKADTDADGLSDWHEVYVTGTEPTLYDTDGNGVSDGDEDADGDGLNNVGEIGYGTDLLKSDTDNDGLNDHEEVTVYGTNPLKYDTDGDGASDGWEVANDYDPVAYNNTFTVEKSASSDALNAYVEVTVDGSEVESIDVEPNTDGFFFDETIPGYLGSAFDFSADGAFSTATISFAVDSSKLSPTANPTIYYFNEESQQLEELPTTYSNGVASATVTHFSTYILLDKVEFDKVWETEFELPDIGEGGDGKKYLDIAFVIDYSASMEDNDPKQLCKQLTQSFLSKMRDGVDRATLVTFIAKAFVPCGLTSDLGEVSKAVDSIVYDSGYGSDSGTNGSDGIHYAIQELSDGKESASKFIVFITDGEDNRTSYDYNALVEEAKVQGIVIHAIGMGNASISRMKSLAEGTGGKYYAASATDSSIDSDDIWNLTDVYEDIESGTIDVLGDSNKDGISDYFTQLLCDGTITMGTGKQNPFAGVPFEDIQANDDYDGDGVPNGTELKVIYTEATKSAYIMLISDPTAGDSDFDGIDDTEDGDPFNNNFTGKYYSYVKEGINVKFKVDYRTLLDSMSSYNQDVSTLMCLFAGAVYSTKNSNLKIEVNGGNGFTGGIEEFYDCFGLGETKVIKLADQYDDDDICDVVIGHRPVKYKGTITEVVVASVRGTDGSVREWSSNFDVGADNNEYWDYDNSEWKNRSNHKGFDVAAVRVYRELNDYINTYLSGSNIAVFLNGHSRGAAVANIVAAMLSDSGRYDYCAYTYATPNTTLASNATSYRNIFNIVNKDDMVPYLPLDDWQFGKYGETKPVSVKDKYENHLFGAQEGTWEWLINANRSDTGIDYNANGNKNSTLKKFGKIVETGSGARDALYVFPDKNYTYTVDTKYMSRSDAESDANKLETDYGERISRFCNVRIVEKATGLINKKTVYAIEVDQKPAFLMMTIARLAGGEAPTVDFATDSLLGASLGFSVAKKYNDAKKSFVHSAIDTQENNPDKKVAIFVKWSHLGGMTHGHMQETYYLLARYMK